MRNIHLSLLVAAMILVCGAVPAWGAEPVVLPNAQMLVNPSFSLHPDFVPDGLTSVSSFARANGDVLLRADAAAALREMLAAMKEAGLTDIYINSGYRSFARQRELYTAKVAFYRQQGSSDATARAQAARWVLPPGESEHQSGLAVDVSSSATGHDLTEAFAHTPAGRWFNEHCVEYGFILRYTAEKELWTGVASEPWHFRYVGADHAYYIQQHGLCLEEYHKALREQSPLLFENARGEKRAIYYGAYNSSADLPGTVLALSLAYYGGDEYIITTQPPAVPLFDTVGHWGESFIRRLHGMEVLRGYEDGSFKPDAEVNRGEFITAFSRLPLPVFTAPPLFDGEEDSTQPVPLSSLPLPYTDVSPEKYYYTPLSLCYNLGLVQVWETKGMGPMLFEASRPLLRGEAALLLAQVISKDNFILPATLSYSDVPPASGLLFPSVELLTARGVLSGNSDGLFHPERRISRAETSAMLCRLLDAKLQENTMTAEPDAEPDDPEEIL